MRNNKIFPFLATFCLLAGVFTSCQKDSVTLRLRVASFSHDGKVHMDGYTPKWDTGSDLVCVNGVPCTVSNNAVSVSPSIDYKAVYPASICGSLENVNGVGVYNLTIPEYQVYKTVTVGGSTIQVVEAPMGAHSNTSAGSADLYFKNLGALLAITVDNQAGRGDLIVDKIIVTSDSKPLWGSATLAMPDVTTQNGDYNPSYIINETDNNHQSVILAGNANGGRMNVSIASGYSKQFYVYVPAFSPQPSNKFTFEVQVHNNSGEGVYRRAQTTAGSGNIPLNEIGSLTFELIRGDNGFETSWRDNTRPAGAIRVGEFSVSATKKVYFSAGNLQYNYAANTANRKFRIAEHQWDYAGVSYYEVDQSVSHYGNVQDGNNLLASNNTNPNYSVQDRGVTEWIDLFGWGTSGHGTGNQAMPYDYSSDKTYGGTTTLDSYYDWGKKNTIYYGSQYSAPGVWRTLTQSEWEYMMGLNGFVGRIVAGGKGLGYTHSFVSVNGVSGLLIYPDGFSGTRVTNTINTTNSRMSPVGLTMNEFQSYENEGCAFLPCAGRRGATGSTSGEAMASNLPGQEPSAYMGAYWLSSLNSGLPYYFEFGPTVTTTTNYGWTKGYGITTSPKFCGYSVRLVTDVPTNNTSSK